MNAGGTFTTWADYFYPHRPGVLKNQLDIGDKAELADTEVELTSVEMRRLILEDAIPEKFDLAHYCGLHREIFGLIYAWAGVPRTVPEGPMTKPWRDVVNHPFDDADAPEVTYQYTPGPAAAARAGSVLALLDYELEQIPSGDVDTFTTKLATCWGGLDKAHPFREGNTRSQVILFDQVCRRYGYQLDGEQLLTRREEFIGARFHGHRVGHYGRLATLLQDAISTRESDRLSEADRQWALALGREATRRREGRIADSGLDL